MKEKIKFNFKAEGLDEEEIDEILYESWEFLATEQYGLNLMFAPHHEVRMNKEKNPYHNIIRNLGALVKNTNLPEEFRTRYTQDYDHFKKRQVAYERWRIDKPPLTCSALNQQQIFTLCMYVAETLIGRFERKNDIYQLVSRIWEFKRGEQIPMKKIREIFCNESVRHNDQPLPFIEI